ncbi:Bug family tripartite tricarboxylate transporter substrate binding protein [Comamonas endophytica]|uniref:Tripartite tricarboxylate transporter substrate binding protein n=1 Tax=Comamonas endophytica TaxID=2949090 RepID=A0ABY6GFG6_9BURK|nr:MULTISPECIES: tripartite tricarboxylate transporter substrate binding protein [unclassified Acidovorax]MCD2513401.1 tripartite tricarboxylate transporter substrate binding protein [Acidovorax sp. D4N7]UYG53816.1 tripartite tricarboxylate transporter substrate binding protein [Acidovorax sp. 5MLIR]
MQRRHFLQASSAAPFAAALPARAQSYPARPVRMVVPFPPGGPVDSFARFYAEAMGKQLGQAVVVENKGGASGALGSLEVKNSPADGYTLLFATASTHALYNLTEPKPRYSAADDFDYIGVLGGAPVAFAVAPSMPKTLKTLVIAAKHNPGKYNYGSPGTGTLMHVAVERFKQLTGAPLMHIPYKGTGPSMQDLMGGATEMAVGTLGVMLPFHRSGRMHIVGVATARRLALAPDIPTIAESADLAAPFEAMLWNVLAAPRGTPAAVKKTLADATRAVMGSPAMAATLGEQGIFADLHIGDAAAAAYVKAETAKWKPVVAQLGTALGQ